jgi:predicted XRE-type DNA-binding protein
VKADWITERVMMATSAKRPKAVRRLSIDSNKATVFGNIDLEEPTEPVARTELARLIREIVEKRNWTQRRAAAALEIAPPDMSDLMRGKVARFSQERLARFLNALGMDVHIQVGPRPPGKRRADVTVESVRTFDVR